MTPTAARVARAAVGARGALSEVGAIVLGIATCVGAWTAVPVPVSLGATGTVAAVATRRTGLLVVASFLLASGLAARATDGLHLHASRYRGSVQVVHVSIDEAGDSHLEVRARNHHVLLVPPHAAHGLLADARPGDEYVVDGRVTPADPIAERGRGRHIAGTLHAAWLRSSGTPWWPWRIADAVHDSVAHLGRALPPGQRSLFDGFVLGDASRQDAVQKADFAGSGLTHLLVASGENVAFVLLLASPALRRTGFRVRWLATVVLLIGFALVTGLEPSVLRASVMAAVVVSGAGLGRPVSSLRGLALAVTALVWADPFLVHSVSFGMSTGAVAGIVVLASPLVAVLPGPEWIARAAAVTVSAQLGVAPLLVGFAHGMPIASLPANLLVAGPAALVVVAGLPCLLLASTELPGTWLAAWVPRLLLGWIAGVARVASAWPLGRLGPGSLLIVSAAIGGLLVAHRAGAIWVRRGCASVAILMGVLPGVHLVASPTGGNPSTGVHVVRRGSTDLLVLTSTPPAVELLEDLSALGVRDLDVVVLPHGDRADLRLLRIVATRCRVGRVISPRPLPATAAVPSQVATTGMHLEVGTIELVVVMDRPVLSVHVEPAGSTHDPG